MIEVTKDLLIGILIIVINAIPFIIKKYNYLLLTSVLSLLLVLLLKFVI